MLASRFARSMLVLLLGSACPAVASPAPPAGGPAQRASEAPAEPAPTASGMQASLPAPQDMVCAAIAAAATRTGLPLGFFTRLIWQESRFDPVAVSRKGARGIAQFMPQTASSRGLRNPFDPVEAIPKSAELLAELRREFGNLGLAAAAYNAGPGRVRDWLAGRRQLPAETQAYVRIVTGRIPAEWAGAGTADAILDALPDEACRGSDQIAAAAAPGAQAPPATTGTRLSWGVQLIGSPSEALALSAWHQLQQKYQAILGGLEPILIHTPVGVRGAFWHRVRVGAASLASANALCSRLRAGGASCLVQRN